MTRDRRTPHQDEQALRVLVLTNHFSAFAGSEVVALQVAQWFAERGHAVTLGANSIGAPLRHCAAGIALTTAWDQIALGDFDLIWCQHDLLSQLPLAAFERASRSRLPHVALVSLSPFEPYEHVDAFLARALSADVYANSPETADELISRNSGAITRPSVRVFHNAAPAAFWKAGPPPGAALRSIALISNHPPPELAAALAALEAAGVHTRSIGVQSEAKLVTPEDIAGVDAVISIGKSVIYAIAQRRPVFMYDHFGGDGWLTRNNFATNLYHNFSGRPRLRRLAPDALAAELLSGYGAAAQEAQRFGECVDLSRLHLDTHMAELTGRARHRPDWRTQTLSHWLEQPQFRAHLATSHQKSAVMRRSYLMLDPGS